MKAGFDTNILIYAMSPAQDTRKHAIAAVSSSKQANPVSVFSRCKH